MDSKLASDGNFIPVGVVRLSPRSRATKDRDLDALQIPRLFGVWHGTVYDVHLCASCMIVDNNVSTVCCMILHENLVFSYVLDQSCHFALVCMETLTRWTRAAYVAPMRL